MELVNVQQREPSAGRWHVTSDSWGIPSACSEEDIKGLASYEPTGYQSSRIMVRVRKRNQPVKNELAYMYIVTSIEVPILAQFMGNNSVIL